MSFSKVHLIFYFYLLKFGLVYGQWNNGNPYHKKTLSNTFSLPVQYVPVSTLTNQDRATSYRQCDSFANGPFPYNLYYQNYPGEAEVGLLQSSYPGQPVIVINNGYSGDCSREREFDIEELLTLMFAFGGLGRGKHNHKSEVEIPRQEPAVSRYPPPYPYYGYTGAEVSESIKPRESPKASKINITIVLPSTSSSTNVQVENKIEEEKKSNEVIDEVNK